MRKSVLFLSAASLAGIAAPAWAADTSADAESGPDTIVVTATRMPKPMSQVGASVSVIDEETIRARQSVAVTDLLRSVPGVTFVRNGGVGTLASVSIRGADNDHSVVLIDGVKLNDPSSSGGGYNFGTMLTDNLSRIEVVRGSQSVLWGSQAIGGVINMITAEPTEKLSAHLTGEYGWRNSRRLAGNVSGKTGRLSASLGAGYFASDNISAFSEARGAKERDPFEHYGVNGKIRLAITDAISFDLRGWYSDGKTHIDGLIPGIWTLGDTNEVSRTKEFIGYAGINAALFDGRFRNRLAYTLTDTKRDSTSYDGPKPSKTFDAKGKNERFEYQGSVDLAQGWEATFGAETEKASYRSSSYGAPFTTAHARINSVYGQLAVMPLAGLTLTGGVRHDDHDTFGGKTTFAANGVFTPNDGATTFRASYGEGFKAPSLFQLFSDYGNKRLQAETSRSWDVGVTQKLFGDQIEAGLIWFERDTSNQIIFISCAKSLTGICENRPNGTYDNVAKARAKGLEASVLVRPIEALTVQANYSWIDARNKLDNTPLPRRPRHTANVALDYAWAMGFKAGASLTRVGSSFDGARERGYMAPYTLVNLRASQRISDNFSVYGRIENLFDEKYETVARYGTPGRAAYGGIRLTY